MVRLLFWGGGFATVRIGAVRFAPLAAVGTGLAIIGHSLLSRPITPSKPLQGKVQPIQKKDNFKKFWQVALAVLVCAIPVFYATRWAGCTPIDVLDIKKGDPQRTMASDLSVKGDFKSIKEINGIPLQKIESRARDLFLGSTETLKNLLSDDWKTVFDLGTTHIELADHLKAIWDQTQNQCGESGTALTDSFLYNPQALVNSTIGKGSQTQILQSCRLDTGGFEPDLFSKEEFPLIDENGIPRINPSSDSLDSYLIIKNPLNGESLGLKYNFIQYIRKYGFYGGKFGNNRVDPVRLVAILTGQSPEEIRKTIS